MTIEKADYVPFERDRLYPSLLKLPRNFQSMIARVDSERVINVRTRANANMNVNMNANANMNVYANANVNGHSRLP